MEKNKIRNAKKLKVASIIGHFGFNVNLLNGQTIKTQNIFAELEKHFGGDNLKKIDTFGGRIKSLLKAPIQSYCALKGAKNVIILPAQNGLRVFVPILIALKKIFKNRKVHYVVIGGWLPEFVKKHKALLQKLKGIDFIYVETNQMKKQLEELGLLNVLVMPNFKDIVPLKENDLIYFEGNRYKLCTFSRVMKEKGIEEAINAVIILNNRYGFEKYSLDIYGQIDKSQIEWFENLTKTFPPFIQYKGEIDSTKSVDVVKNYYALLFPTYYDGEGFAGTLLDAMAAGVPIIASDWKFNNEIINQNNGVLVRTHDIEGLADAIDKLDISKKRCLIESYKYLPKNAIRTLVANLNVLH